MQTWNKYWVLIQILTRCEDKKWILNLKDFKAKLSHVQDDYVSVKMVYFPMKSFCAWTQRFKLNCFMKMCNSFRPNVLQKLIFYDIEKKLFPILKHLITISSTHQLFLMTSNHFLLRHPLLTNVNWSPGLRNSVLSKGHFK